MRTNLEQLVTQIVVPWLESGSQETTFELDQPLTLGFDDQIYHQFYLKYRETGKVIYGSKLHDLLKPLIDQPCHP